MNAEWKVATKYIIGVALAILGIYFLYLSRSVLYLLLAGALIAFVLNPLVRALMRRLRFPKWLAILVSHLLAGLVLLLAPLVLIPPILNAVNTLLGIDYQVLINDSLLWFETTLETLQATGLRILGVTFVLDSIIEPLLNYLHGVSPEFQPQLPTYNVIVDSVASAFTVSYGIAVSLVGSVLSGIVAFAFMLLSSIYFSMDGQRFYRGFLKLFPESQRYEVATLSKRIRYIWGAFFRGQLALMVIIGVTVWLGLTILGVPGAFALAVIAGLLEIVPSLGPILAAIPAVLVALIQGSSHFDINHVIFALIVIGFYVLVQAFENYMIVPQVLGEAVELHPLVVMAGVLAGATIWGILGALLAAPVIATGKEIFEYLHRKLLDQDPFPVIEVIPERKISWWKSLKTFLLKGRAFAEDRIYLPKITQEKESEEETEGEEEEKIING